MEEPIMDDLVFDAFSRRAAEVLHRRSVLGVLSGAALAALTPFAADAKKGGGKDGGKGGKGGNDGKRKGKNGNGKKKGKKGPRCKSDGNLCRASAANFCSIQFPTDPAKRDACNKAFATCCRLEDNCKRQAAQQCFNQTAQDQIGGGTP
jgi:hypothetical protein